MSEHTHGEHKKGACNCDNCCEECRSGEKGFLSSFTSKGAFFLGLGSALVVFFAIGFFVLLGVVLNGGRLGEVAGMKTTGNLAQANPTPSADQLAPEQAAPNADGMRPISSDDWMSGDKNAPVTVVEYSDYECPFCKRHHPTIEQLVAEYDGKVNWVYRHFPLDMHPKAKTEAEAAECVGELGGSDAFWKFTDRIFEITPGNNGLDLAELPKIAEFAGVNVARFNECFESGKYRQKVEASVQDAVAAGGNGTPHNVIVAGNTKIVLVGAQPIEAFKAEIDKLLK